MREVYRKRGSVLRYEHGFFVRAVESGEAIEEDGIFECRPWRDAQPLPPAGDASVRETVQRIQSAIRGDVSIERLIVTGLGGLVWMSIGGFIMAKMVSFEI